MFDKVWHIFYGQLRTALLAHRSVDLQRHSVFFLEFLYDFSHPYPPIESFLSYPNRNIAAYTTIHDHNPTFIIPVDTSSHELNPYNFMSSSVNVHI